MQCLFISTIFVIFLLLSDCYELDDIDFDFRTNAAPLVANLCLKELFPQLPTLKCTRYQAPLQRMYVLAVFGKWIDNSILAKLHFALFLNQKNAKRTTSLLALAVGIKQKTLVNQIVNKFLERGEFVVMLFHYDSIVDEWREFEWSDRVIHVSASNQTKW